MVEENEKVESAVTEETVEPVSNGQDTSQAPDETTEDTPKEATSTQSGESDSRNEPEFVKHVQNWRALREAREKAERERDELLARMQASQRGEPQRGEPQRDWSQRGQEEDLRFNDDDLIEGKHLKNTISKTDQRIRQLEGQLIEAQIRAKYPDFDEIVTSDTVGMLKDTDPELAESIAANPNLYSQAVAAYKSIKRYGIVNKDYAREKEKVNVNLSKPRTVTSLSPQQGDSPLTRANAFANGLTDDLKQQLWQEMQDLANNS